MITTASGKRHSTDPADWKWWDRCVPTRLKELYNDEGWVVSRTLMLTSQSTHSDTITNSYRVVILSNQGGLTLHPDPKSKAPKNLIKNRLSSFKQKCSAVLAQLDIPLTLYAATGKDMCRKPRTGMWAEMCDDYDLAEPDVDLENSIFVGDAGGRAALVKGTTTIPKDFSCSDRNLAHNVGIPFRTPEEFFLKEPPRDFTREFDLSQFPFVGDDENESTFEKKNKQEVVLFCAPPGAGKSTFYWTQLKPLGYARINQDTLKR